MSARFWFVFGILVITSCRAGSQEGGDIPSRVPGYTQPSALVFPAYGRQRDSVQKAPNRSPHPHDDHAWSSSLKKQAVAVHPQQAGSLWHQSAVQASASIQKPASEKPDGWAFMQAPLFYADNQSTTLHQRAQQHKKPVLILLWATFCGPCVKELKSVAQLMGDARVAPYVDIVPVCLDMPATQANETLRHVLKAQGMTTHAGHTLAADQTLHAVLDHHGIRGIPYALVISPSGHIVDQLAGAHDWNSAVQKEWIMRAAKNSSTWEKAHNIPQSTQPVKPGVKKNNQGGKKMVSRPATQAAHGVDEPLSLAHWHAQALDNTQDSFLLDRPISALQDMTTDDWRAFVHMLQARQEDPFWTQKPMLHKAASAYQSDQLSQDFHATQPVLGQAYHKDRDHEDSLGDRSSSQGVWPSSASLLDGAVQSKRFFPGWQA